MKEIEQDLMVAIEVGTTSAAAAFAFLPWYNDTKNSLRQTSKIDAEIFSALFRVSNGGDSEELSTSCAFI